MRAMAPHSWQHLTVLLCCDYRRHRISTRLRESKDLVHTLPLHRAPCSFSKCPKDVVVGYARIHHGGCGGACVTSCESHRIRLSSMSRLLGLRPIGNRRVYVKDAVCGTTFSYGACLLRRVTVTSARFEQPILIIPPRWHTGGRW